VGGMKGKSEPSPKKHRTYGVRLILSILCSLLFTTIIFYVISELTVVWYMHQHGITVRSELSEDMGLGMLILFPFLIYVPISLVASFLICLNKFK
jgi:hypothetical protein